MEAQGRRNKKSRKRREKRKEEEEELNGFTQRIVRGKEEGRGRECKMKEENGWRKRNKEERGKIGVT